MRLTAKSVQHIKAGTKRREIPDNGCAGLYLIVQPSGAKSWALRYRYEGRPTKLTLKEAKSLADARSAAVAALRELERGNDPAEAKKAAAIKAAAAKADTVVAVCEEYLKREGKKLRTADQRVSILNRLVYPRFGERPIETIKRGEIARLLDDIEDASGPRMADVTLATLRRIFNWHALRSDEFRSPIVRGMARTNAKERARSRILSDDELRAVLAAAMAADGFGALVRFLLLTSARRGEAAAMRWDEVDADGLWTLPASRSKTKVGVPRPLSHAAQSLLEAQPRIEGCPYVFTADGITPTQNFSRGKSSLDAASGVTDWRLHDLRRTARSLLSRAGVNPDVAERCLGHAIPGVRGIYDRHKFIDEMRHAFEALAAQIERIVNRPEGNVVALRGA
jgi:integrase